MKRISSYKQAFPTGRGISQQVVRVLCLIIALSAGATTASTDWDYKTKLTFTPSYATSYTYTQTPIDWDTKTIRDPEAPLETNEIFRVAIAQDARTDKSTPPFTIDEAGQLVGCSTNDVQAAWCTLSLNVLEAGTADYIAVGDTAGIPDGEPDDAGTSCHIFASYEAGFEAKEGATVTNYLVAFDTRDRDGEEGCPGEPKRVSRYAVRKIADVTNTPPDVDPDEALATYYDVYVAPRSHSRLTTIAPPGCELSADFKTFVTNSWTNTVAISSYTLVDSETGEEKVLTGDALEAYLTPTFSGATVSSASTALASAQVLSAEESTTPSASTSGDLTITVSSPDLIYYTLYTGTSPQADDTWQTWEKFLEEKGLDISDAKAYSKFRVNEGGTAIVLPKVEGETRRFYQLRGANH